MKTCPYCGADHQGHSCKANAPLSSNHRDECSALERRGYSEHCANGFPVNAGCVGIVGAVPVCCNERLCGRMYPETGKPDRCVL